MKEKTPLHEMPKVIQDFELKHGFKKTKAMVEFYDYSFDFECELLSGSQTHCIECGAPTNKKIRCIKCHLVAWEKYQKEWGIK